MFTSALEFFTVFIGLVSALAGQTTLPVEFVVPPSSYVLQEEVKYDYRNAQEEAVQSVRELLQAQMKAGNLGPLSPNKGTTLELFVRWQYDDLDHLPLSVYIQYRVGNLFEGSFTKNRDDLPPVSMIRLLPKHRDLAELAVQHLIQRWNRHLTRAYWIDYGLKGAPTK